MRLIAEALSPAMPAAAAPLQAPAATPAATPAWPLLDALTQPPAAAEPREPARGTLVQLFGGFTAPAATAPPAPPAPLPTALPLAAFAPPGPQGGAALPLASPLPAIPAGPFPAAWAPPPSAAEPAGSPSLVPADRVTSPLTEVLQNLGRGGPAENPAFAGLRLPGNGSR
jgi:hypothetical protein